MSEQPFLAFPTAKWHARTEYRIGVECPCGYMAWAYQYSDAEGCRAFCTKCGRSGEVEPSTLPPLPAPPGAEQEPESERINGYVYAVENKGDYSFVTIRTYRRRWRIMSPATLLLHPEPVSSESEPEGDDKP